MAARKLGMVVPFQPADHISGLRKMRDPERALVKTRMKDRQRPMYIFALFSVGWGVMILIFGTAMNQSACFISLALFIVVFALGMSIRDLNKPLAQALEDNVVLEFTGTCTGGDGTNIRVGPLDIRVPGELAPIFQEGKFVTVGHVPDTFFAVSVNGIVLNQLLAVTTAGPLEPIVKDKLAVWEDMSGAGSAPTYQQLAFAAAGAVPQGQVQEVIIEERSQEGNYIIAKKYKSSGSGTKKMVYSSRTRATQGNAPVVQQGQPSMATTPFAYLSPTSAPSAQPAPVAALAPVAAPVPVAAPAPAVSPAPVVSQVQTAPAPGIASPPPVVSVQRPDGQLPPFCPYHGHRTELRDGKVWCKECEGYLNEPPEYCPYHGCRTELRDDKAFCPRCEDIVELP